MKISKIYPYLELKLKQLFCNNEKLFKLYIFSIKIRKRKCIYITLFTKFYLILVALKIKTGTFITGHSLYVLPQIFSEREGVFFIIKYVKMRKICLFYFKKKLNIKKKGLFIKHFTIDSKLFFFYWNFYFLKNHVIYLLKKFSMNFFFFLIVLMDKKYMKIKSKKNGILNLIFLEDFLKKYYSFVKLIKHSLKLVGCGYISLFFFIGEKNIKKIEWLKLENKYLLNIYNRTVCLFGFLNYKRNIFKKETLNINIELYRFWKKINTHQFFLCPIEKDSSKKKIAVLPCGHIFSLGTIIKLSDKILTNENYLNQMMKMIQIKLIECPWCDIIHENWQNRRLAFDSCDFLKEYLILK